MFGRSGGFAPVSFPLFSYSTALAGLRDGIHLILHGHTPRLGTESEEDVPADQGGGIRSVFGLKVMAARNRRDFPETENVSRWTRLAQR